MLYSTLKKLIKENTGARVGVHLNVGLVTVMGVNSLGNRVVVLSFNLTPRGNCGLTKAEVLEKLAQLPPS